MSHAFFDASALRKARWPEQSGLLDRISQVAHQVNREGLPSSMVFLPAIKKILRVALRVTQVPLGALCGALVVSALVRFKLLPEPVHPIFYLLPSGMIGAAPGAAFVIARMREPSAQAKALAEMDSILSRVELDARQRATGFANSITEAEIPYLEEQIRKLAKWPELVDLRTHAAPLQ